jgi:methyl-accepting chemotaxis protein
MMLKQKITYTLLLLVLLPLLLSNILATEIAGIEAHTALEKLTKDRLVALRNIKKSEVESYFSTIENQLINLASLSYVGDALVDFKSAAQTFSQQSGINSTNSIKSYYNNQFASRYAEKNAGQKTLNINGLITPLSQNSLALQTAFIADNPAPLGEKDTLVDLNNGSSYALSHSQYHPFFRDFLKRFGFYDIFLVDVDSGMVVYSVFKELDFATSLKTGPYASSGIGDVYKQAKALPEGQSILVDFKPYTPSYEDAASFIGSPIYVNGRVEGVLIFQMPVDRINSLMTMDGKWREDGLGDTGETYLVGPDKLFRSQPRFLIEDKPGYLASLTESEQYDNKTIRLIDAKDSVIGVQKVDTVGENAVLSGEEGVLTFSDYRGVNVISAFSPINVEGLNWSIFAEIEEQEAFDAGDVLVEDLWISSGLTLFIIGIVAVFVSVKFANYMTSPIIAISKFIRDTGDSLDLTKRLKIQRDDEIGQATASLNSMLDSMQSTFTSVVDGFRHITTSAQSTASISQEISSAAESQQAETEQLASAMVEMSATANDVARNITDTSSATEKATGEVRVGLGNMDKMLAKINDVSTITSQAAQDINDLKQKTTAISSVVDVINSVAEQTNLLALNAAIEAARAGEHGRGFAVVADEVRTLASRTTQSTSEITEMINLLQTAASQAVTSIETSVENVDESVVQANATAQALQVIDEVIFAINERSAEIATAAEQQEAVSQNINQNVCRISEMAGETSEGTIKNTEQTQQLLSLTAELNQQIAKFKI